MHNIAALMVVEWREGDVIRRLRKAAEWALEDLAAASGVNIQVIHKIESGRTKEAKRATLRKIAGAFGISERQLIEAIPPPIDLPLTFAAVEPLRVRRKRLRPQAANQRTRLRR